MPVRRCIRRMHPFLVTSVLLILPCLVWCQDLLLGKYCADSWNGRWGFQGLTKSGKPFYTKRINNVAWYIYHDSDCDGEAGPVTGPLWMLNDVRPSTTRGDDLENDGTCMLPSPLPLAEFRIFQKYSLLLSSH